MIDIPLIYKLRFLVLAQQIRKADSEIFYPCKYCPLVNGIEDCGTLQNAQIIINRIRKIFFISAGSCAPYFKLALEEIREEFLNDSKKS